uniref:Uncharacterized protein n=1 Tax=Leishmania guyanensis TaxID=5670 RepID=A0A1E1J153_LEIGU
MGWKRRCEVHGDRGSGSSNPGGSPGRGATTSYLGDGESSMSGFTAMTLLDAASQLQPQPFSTRLSGSLGVMPRARREKVASCLFNDYVFCVLYGTPGSVKAWRKTVTGTAGPSDVDGGAGSFSSLSNWKVVEQQLQRHGGQAVASRTCTTSLRITHSISATKLINWIQLCESKLAHVRAK